MQCETFVFEYSLVLNAFDNTMAKCFNVCSFMNAQFLHAIAFIFLRCKNDGILNVFLQFYGHFREKLIESLTQPPNGCDKVSHFCY